MPTPVSTASLSCEQVVWNENSKLYSFDDAGGIPRTLPVAIIQGGTSQTEDRLQVKTSKGWIPLHQWLLTLPFPRLTGKEGIIAQQKAWELNKHTFQLMKLPMELRTMIFKEVLGPAYILAAGEAHIPVDGGP
jgi:hypothetical protein